MRLWAVYDLQDDLGAVAWPLDRTVTGEYAVVLTDDPLDMPALCPLPRSVHRTRAAANRALALILYDCRGSS